MFGDVFGAQSRVVEVNVEVVEDFVEAELAGLIGCGGGGILFGDDRKDGKEAVRYGEGLGQFIGRFVKGVAEEGDGGVVGEGEFEV